MNDRKALDLLYQYAAGYKFNEFDELFCKSVSGMSAEMQQDAYLMRAQIKMIAGDVSFLDDIIAAESTDAPPQFPCLIERWVPDGNRFFVFRTYPGEVQHFLAAVIRAEKTLKSKYGAAGAGIARQLMSEIYYFIGETERSLELAEKQYYVRNAYPAEVMLALYCMFRCYIALGQPDKAEKCMLEMINIAKTHPECISSYQTIRSWANTITGWSGDNPRFAESVTEPVPVFEDRLNAIRRGIALPGANEVPFVEYAERHYSEVCSMKRFFMDIFYTLYWYHAGDYYQSDEYFLSVYRTASTNGLIMPFAEYGKQIIPLLRHMRGRVGCSELWLDKVAALAEKYEVGLSLYIK